ncbi:MAG: cytochrome c biogenesis protein CcsA [Planctomycetota bacterium]|nr:cytochrome c biogenesis protein CcsA [Planctomycetota bacterium]
MFPHRALPALFCLAALTPFALRAESGDPDAPPKQASPHGESPHGHGAHGEAHHGHDRADEEDVPRPPSVLVGEMDFRAIKALAIQEGGRKKPLQTFATEALEQVYGPSMRLFNPGPAFKDPATGEAIEGIDLFLRLWLSAVDNWEQLPLVLVPYKPLRTIMELDEGEKRFPFKVLAQNKKFNELYNSALKKRHQDKADDMSALEREAELVGSRMDALLKIVTQQVAVIPHPTDKNGTWVTIREFSIMMGATQDEALEYLVQNRYRGNAELAGKLYADYTNNYKKESRVNLAPKFRAFAEAYYKRDKSAFSQASADLRSYLATLSPTVYPDAASLTREIRYQEQHPFAMAWRLYLLALFAGLVAWKLREKVSYALTWALFLGGLAYHFYGFTLRCLIAGRPPVTNMYESVIWVGFGVVFFGMIFEALYRVRYYLFCGAFGGFLCLMLMDLIPWFAGNAQLPGFESKINPLVPVLRDNFWLTIHVLTITLSYAAFALAWLLGHATLGWHLFKPAEKHEQHQLHGFVYRVLQVGVLLLASGTILGGVWAYYSWGRFWGWDPKETWAFIALICYLIVLHGRFTGWWGNFGLSVGSVVSFNAVVMAWYGVNFVLGSGLHSYGAGANMGQRYVVALACLDLAFVAVSYWSYFSYKKSSLEAEAETLEANADVLTASDPIEDEVSGAVTAK